MPECGKRSYKEKKEDIVNIYQMKNSDSSLLWTELLYHLRSLYIVVT